MKKLREDEIRIAAEAARWQRLLESDDPATIAEFADWVKASPRHLREFMFMEALASAAGTIDPEKKIEIDLDCARREGSVITLARAPAGEQRGRTARWRIPAMIAAGFSALALGLTAWLTPHLLGGWQQYSTAVGEQRDVSLSDGSVVQLNVRSRLRVRFSETSRELQLMEGEALFKVAPDRARPFEVQAGETIIRAVGTAFNVHRTEAQMTVAVLEGKVQIESVTPEPAAPANYLASGETARVERRGAMVRKVRAPVAEAVAWRQRRLVFREETLAVIADEFNRYNKYPQITVVGEAARARRLGGTFDANDTDSLVQLAMRTGDLVAERRDGEIVISASVQP